MSHWWRPGCRNGARPELPKVPAAGGANASGLNQYGTPLTKRSPTIGSPTWSAKTPRRNVSLSTRMRDIGWPDEMLTMPATCQPPSTALRQRAAVAEERQLIGEAAVEDVAAIGARVGVVRVRVRRILRDVDARRDRWSHRSGCGSACSSASRCHCGRLRASRWSAGRDSASARSSRAW